MTGPLVISALLLLSGRPRLPPVRKTPAVAAPAATATPEPPPPAPPAPPTPPALAPPTRQALRLAVLTMEGSGIDASVVNLVDESLLAELRKLAKTSVVGMAEIRQMLDFEATRQTLGCGAEGSCLAEIADSLGVDVLLTGSLARVGTDSIFVLRRIDQRTAAVAGTFTRRLVAADGEELLAAVGPAVAELFAEVPLRAGQTRGVDPKLALRLNPPPLPPWLATSTGIAAASTLVVAGVAFVGSQLVLADYKNTVQTANDEDGIDGKTLVATGAFAQQLWTAAWITLGAGVSLLGVTAGLVPLTDWQQPQDQP